MTLAGSTAKSSTAQAGVLALFVSDLHLQDAMPRSAEAFLRFLDEQARHAKQLYLLGDLFEYWAGDDDLDSPFNRHIVDALRAVADAGVEIFWIAGNRDFLVGAAFAAAIGATLLPDPFVVTLAGQKIVLAHGDAQCTDDLAYMAFRAQVREPAWQAAFLAQPLAKRKEIIAGLREGSRAAQQMKSAEIMDVNPQAITALFDRAGAALMIHGHTHRPARHVSAHAGGDRLRYVLPDWDCEGSVPRGGWIALHSDGQLERINVDGYPAAE
jgi:UDP-2,3-diacylglucosamine hydrolase